MSNPNSNVYIIVDQESEEDSEEKEQEEFIPVTESPRALSRKKGQKGREGRICSSAGKSGKNS